MPRALSPDLKVLFITGYAENAVVSNGRLGKGMHVVSKPLRSKRLPEKIRQMIKG